jgi:hypothetical protein
MNAKPPPYGQAPLKNLNAVRFNYELLENLFITF